MGGVLNNREAAELIGKTEHFNFDSLENAAQRMIDQARKDADAEIARAKREIDKLRTEIRGQEFEAARKEGYDKGYAEGSKKGHAEGLKQASEQHLKELREQSATLAQMLESLLREIEGRREMLIETSERDLLALSVVLGTKLARMKIESTPDAVHKALHDAIDLVLSRRSLDVFVSPADLDAVDRYLPELRKAFGDLGAVRVHPDVDLSRASVVVRTGRGEVSLRLEDQIDTIARELLGLTGSETAKAAFEGDTRASGSA